MYFYLGRLLVLFLLTLDKDGKAYQGQHSSLLRKFANYVHKKFYNIGPSLIVSTSLLLYFPWQQSEIREKKSFIL
jgi:hypothetical protein